MTRHEIVQRRTELSHGLEWPGRFFAVPPARWREMAGLFGGCGPVELRVAASAKLGIEELMAAALLRDAGIGLALTGVCRAEHFALVRRLPVSAIIAAPALAGDTADIARVRDRWADSARRRRTAFVVPAGVDNRDFAILASAGFTHRESRMGLTAR